MGAPAKETSGADVQATNRDDERLWQACKKLPSDFDPCGQRKWLGSSGARPDCASCRWFTELFRNWPQWGACLNPESPRAGLLTNWEQGCWQHEARNGQRNGQALRARCGFSDWFERALREQAAEFVREQVRKANDPCPEDKPSALRPAHIREDPLLVTLRRLIRHAAEDFRRRALDEMAARARRDTQRYWEFSRRFWARDVGVEISEILLPENTRELEHEFWRLVDVAIGKALGGRGSRTAHERRRRAG